MIIYSKKHFKIILFILIIFGLFLFGYFYNNNKIQQNQVPLTSGDNVETAGEAFINSGDSGCFTPDEVPKNNEYILYKYDRECYISLSYSKKGLVIQNLLDKNYNLLYESRKYFDREIKKLHDASKDMKFLWHPDQKKQEYSSIKKESYNGKIEEEESVINIGKYKLTIISPWDTSGLDDESLYTHIVITNGGKSIETRDYKGVTFNHVYKIQVNQIFYYILGLCSGGMHGCGILVPIVNDGDKLVVGNSIKGVDFSNYLRIKDFFTKNDELYTVFDDSRYFGEYPSSNNASYNSAVPKVFRFNKTGNAVLVTDNFLELYQKPAKIIFDGLTKLKNSIPIKARNVMMQTMAGKSLIPYFDYYLGISILANKTNASQIRKQVKKLYFNLYGKKYSLKAHFNGYKDFEK